MTPQGRRLWKPCQAGMLWAQWVLGPDKPTQNPCGGLTFKTGRGRWEQFLPRACPWSGAGEGEGCWFRKPGERPL